MGLIGFFGLVDENGTSRQEDPDSRVKYNPVDLNHQLVNPLVVDQVPVERHAIFVRQLTFGQVDSANPHEFSHADLELQRRGVDHERQGRSHVVNGLELLQYLRSEEMLAIEKDQFGQGSLDSSLDVDHLSTRQFDLQMALLGLVRLANSTHGLDILENKGKSQILLRQTNRCVALQDVDKLVRSLPVNAGFRIDEIPRHGLCFG